MTAPPLLELHKISVSAVGTQILQDIDLTIPEGTVHVLFGPNGSGKSSLLSAIMGLPPYEITAGTVRFRGQSLAGLPIDERARIGLGLAFQRPPSLPGVRLREFADALGAEPAFASEAPALDLADFVGRELAVGFSGGEIKRWEVLKLFLQNPECLLFDEPESGVDLEHVAAVGAAIARLMAMPGSAGGKRSGILITHTGLILNHVTADMGHVLIEGRLVRSGPPAALFDEIRTTGYRAFAAAAH